MNGCVFKKTFGREPNCNGVCKLWNNACKYYYIDHVWNIMNEWKKEANVDTPIVWKYDNKRGKMCIYTQQPSHFIGVKAERYNKYWQKLKEADKNNQFIQNGIDIIECNDGIG